MQCTKCQATIAEGIKFCPKCGTRAETSVAEIGGKRCPQCGTENPANAKFCKKDGYRFAAPEQNVPPPAPVRTSMSKAVPSAQPPAVPQVVEPIGVDKVQAPHPKSTPPAADEVVCPKCGSANASTAKFCKKDGYPLQPTGAAAPPGAVPPVSLSARPAPMDSPVTFAAPKTAPQPIPVVQPTPSVPRPSVSAAPREPVKPAASQSRKGLMTGAAISVAILASASGGYAYWAGYVGNRQGSVQNEINAELGSHGLSNIKVTVSHEWVASLTGTVPNQSEKDQAFGLVSGHKVLESIVNEVRVKSSEEEVEKNLNKILAEAGFSSVPMVKVNKDMTATLRGSANDQTEKDQMLALATSVDGVKGVRDEIEIAPETIPEPGNPDLAVVAQPSAQFPLQAQTAPSGTVDRAALERELNSRLRANGLNGVIGHVNPDMSVALSGTAGNADERYQALTIGGSLPGANGVRETIQVVAPQIARLALPQSQIQAPPPQTVPPTSPPQAAAIDPSKLEGDINRALRSRGINSVTAQVNDDMSLTLKGSARASEKERALQLARQVRGIRGVKDKVFVVED